MKNVEFELDGKQMKISVYDPIEMLSKVFINYAKYIILILCLVVWQNKHLYFLAFLTLVRTLFQYLTMTCIVYFFVIKYNHYNLL